MARIPCTSVPSPAKSGAWLFAKISAAALIAVFKSVGLPDKLGVQALSLLDLKDCSKNAMLLAQPFLIDTGVMSLSYKSSQSMPHAGQVTEIGRGEFKLFFIITPILTHQV